MVGDIALFVLVGLLLVGGIGGGVYLAHRLTAPAARRLRENAEQVFYAGMMARGRAIPLPRIWRSEGLSGHERRQMRDYAWVLKWSLASVAGVYLLLALVSGAWGEMLGQLAIAGIFVTSVMVAIFLYERRRVKRHLARAALVPRTAFNIVANDHGLFVPAVDGMLSGAWSDWIVTEVALIHGKYGIAGCEHLSVAKREAPEAAVPLITSTIENGAELMEVIAARVARRADGSKVAA